MCVRNDGDARRHDFDASPLRRCAPRPLPLARDPAIADPGFGQDEPRVRGVVAELLAELTHIDAQVVALAAVALTPDLTQEVLLCQELARVADEELEQRELCARQVYGGAVEAHAPPGEVDLDAVDAHERGRRARLRNPAQGRTYAREQLLGVERFRHV